MLATFTRSQTPSSDPDSVYRELSAKLRSGDLRIDFQALRFACSAAKQCEVRVNVTNLQAMTEATDRKDWSGLRQLCEKLLGRGYADIEVHTAMTVLSKELRDAKSIAFHNAVVAGLLNSIRSKKGDRKETAMEVISHREISLVLSSMQLPYFGPTVGWTKFPENGHDYEEYEVVDPGTKKKTQVWFNLDHVNKLKDVTNRP